MIIQLADTAAAFSIAQSELVREKQQMADKAANMVDMENYQQVAAALAEQENKVKQLEVALQQRANESARLLMGRWHNLPTLAHCVQINCKSVYIKASRQLNHPILQFFCWLFLSGYICTSSV